MFGRSVGAVEENFNTKSSFRLVAVFFVCLIGFFGIVTPLYLDWGHLTLQQFVFPNVVLCTFLSASYIGIWLVYGRVIYTVSDDGIFVFRNSTLRRHVVRDQLLGYENPGLGVPKVHVANGRDINFYCIGLEDRKRLEAALLHIGLLEKGVPTEQPSGDKP